MKSAIGVVLRLAPDMHNYFVVDSEDEAFAQAAQILSQMARVAS